MNLLDILVDRNVVSKEDAGAIQKEVRASGAPLDELLSKRGISADALLEAKGDFYGLPVKILENEDIAFSVLEYIPEESAIHYKFVPLGVTDGVLEVGIVDPENIEARDALNFISSKVDMPFRVFLISEQDFARVLEMYRGLSGEVTKALTELETELTVDTAKDESFRPEELAAHKSEGKETNTRIIEDAPVTKIVATVLRYATEGNASDVHIEHMGEKIRIRFRVDGVLNTSLILPPKVHSALVARIKILSNMKLDEKRKPQDGRFTAKIEGRKIDFRVSTFPTYHGEKIVMRILDQQKGVKKIEEMGMTERNLELIRLAIKRPYGMILISGPTGSGKTTTLYSMLNEINREEKNVLSLEDPIEYNIEGVSQSQVRPEIGYTFANGLRTTLRQDPDVIMVGEIRDKETAQLAVQAALTGHLVLSTIHTNNAIGVIPRLLDMGVDPYLISPTLILAIAQRLVGTANENAVRSEPIEDSIKVMIEKQFSDVPAKWKSQIPNATEVYHINPTPESPNGTLGRTAVFEVLKMDAEIEKLILKSPNEADLFKAAREQGMFTMKEDAIIKALKKVIPFEEVNKL